MSEENNLDAKHFSASEEAFEKFQADSLYDEEEFITLSDIAPPQNIIPDLNDDLNEIPYDNEVVLDSFQSDDQVQVNNHNGTGLKLLDISVNNALNERPPGTNNGNDTYNMSLNEQKNISSDGLGDQNYVVEDSSSMIQDSFLSTTLDQSDAVFETPAEDRNASSYPRRTKRGRIPNTAKYPMTSTSHSEAETSKTHAKRRPGRPKKVPPVQSISEPDSTNIDPSLLHGIESVTDVSTSKLAETQSTSVVQKGKRGRRKRTQKTNIQQTPASKKPLASQISENSVVDSTKPENNSQMELDSTLPSDDINNATPNTSKRRKKNGKKNNETSQIKSMNLETKSDIDDDGDDICLSKLKNDLKDSEILSPLEQSIPSSVINKSLLDELESKPIDDIESDLALIFGEEPDNTNSEDAGVSSSRRNTKVPAMSDYEYNVDKVVRDATAATHNDDECLLVEENSKRRRVAKKTFVYDEGSEEEDPYANMDSSDDEPKRKKKGTKYYSDDEYIPESDSKKKGGGKIKSSSSESADEDIDDETDFPKKKKVFGVSPFKRGRKPVKSDVTLGTSTPKPLDKSLVSTIEPKCDDDDIEGCLQTTMIKIDETLRPPAEAWAKSNEFQNFIASNKNSSLQIKKVSAKEITETIAPLDIPVIDPKYVKKTIETSAQTMKTSTSSVSVQTSAPYDIPMKMNIDLTPAQSEKACEFLTSVVKTTVELGQLMSTKSEDFMKKKMNPENVTDTFKMDYCVRKSFLLFKLAKHNLLQMEDDLANQYEAFLKEHKLSLCREAPKEIKPQVKIDSDSDCEIVEVVGACGSGAKQQNPKPKVNPKTVFLNKELSIKIAKKPNAPEKPVPGKKKLEIKGRHAVWINKNVMVKKVTPTQSFLAQDSRNKKPPDVITEKMVSDFFKSYNRKRALLTCAPFIDNDWICVQRQYVCHYFLNDLNTTKTEIATNNIVETPEENGYINETNNYENPKTLFSLSTRVILKCLHNKNMEIEKYTCNVADGEDTGPVALFRLCLDVLRNNLHKEPDPCNVYKDDNTEENTDEENNMLNVNNIDSTEKVKGWIDDCSFDDNSEYNGQGVKSQNMIVSPLTSICYRKIVKTFFTSEMKQDNFSTHERTSTNDVSVDNNSSIDSFSNVDDDINLEDIHTSDEEAYLMGYNDILKEPKSLFSLCVELIQNLQGFTKKLHDQTNTSHESKIKPLKTLTFEIIRNILHPRCNEEISDFAIGIATNNDYGADENFTINCVNTLTEEAFDSLQVPIRIRKQSQDSSNMSDVFENDNYADHHDEINYNAVNEAEDNGWASQLQVQEFRSCFTPHIDAESMVEADETVHEPDEVTPHIKSEPLDDYAEENIVDTSIVKTEPTQAMAVSEPEQGLALNQMTHIPDYIITKRELIDSTIRPEDSPSHIQSSCSYNVESFEQFVKTNKMIQSMDDSMDDSDIFSQSGLRIRRQHEPDLDPVQDPNMSLLVPHTFEPLHLMEAKGTLMESSSDDGNSSKKTGKKKEKKKKKPKKDSKTTTKEVPVVSKEMSVMNEKIVPENEVAVLTRRMREKIRQEEKKVQSSDSDSEHLYLLPTKKDKGKKDKNDHKESSSDSDTFYMLTKIDDTDDKIEKSEDIKEKTKATKSKQSIVEVIKPNKKTRKQDLVQCNAVDSTETLEGKEITGKDQFSGFSIIDQNETANYQKLLQFVYDKILPEDNKHGENRKDNAAEGPDDGSLLMNPDEPVELLECEPTMPIFDNEPSRPPGPKKTKNKKNKEMEKEVPKDGFIERHGWHCYSVNSNDAKIYAQAQIVLEKLPESFVEIYKEYQDVMDKDLDDHEVDRLTNLQSLSRSAKDFKDSNKKGKLKSTKEGRSELNSGNLSRASSPTYSDHFDELVPSDEDEGAKPEDETPPPMPARSSENHLAKNLLMDDKESDSDGGENKIKQEPKDVDAQSTKKSGHKLKTKVHSQDPESLMLTADKMMNKELNLLHAPIVLQEDADTKTQLKDAGPKDENKHSKKFSKRHSKDRVKNDDDTSSEEEKQWVSTKEKLLKRMGKKEDVVADDAKRAKLVNEFIERRNEAERKDKRETNRGRNQRLRMKRLERQKQLRFLSNELYNEGVDGVITGKRGAAAGLFKGRRNIRKVIDKKSLARSTVVANMEEFERKRRLTMRQNKLREVLGCEEGVNVLVINDEVCLEYDFEEQRPVVSVHPFFTKVMKAHQYEGVKFMWDACFESLHNISMGEPGGGCILAHCMGLGKTLQVLALLHTVLTHPRANMQRVLVCCPLSTVLNWVDEIHKWIGPVTHQIKVFELSKLRKTYERAYQLEDWYNGGGIFIIGYELFRSLTTLDPEIDEIRPTIINKIRTALLDPGPDIIVCDEGHLLKNDCTVLAVAMSRVVTKRRIVLTGTPMQNNLREYFCMVNFIKPNLLGTYSEYSNRFENPIMNGQHRDSLEADIKLMKARTHILHKVLEGCLQRQEASVLYPYLPKKNEYTVFIPLTQCQWDLYNHYIEYYAKTQKQKHILKDFHILQKIWSHPQVLHNFYLKARDKRDKIKAEKLEDDLALADQEADIKPACAELWWLPHLGDGAMLDSLESSNKFVAVFRILHECVALGDKVLIFSTSLFCLDALEYFLKKIKKWSLGHEYYRLDGSVPAEVRQKWCREFNAENNLKTKLFLISTRAGCLGLNMTAANRVIILDTSWNPAHDIQSIFRVYRFGQKKDCYIYRLVALGTMEQKIYERSVTKQAVSCRVVDEQQIDRHYNLAELTELYSVDYLGLSVAGGVAVGVADVALLRVARDAAVHAVHEHDSLLRGEHEQGLPEHERAAAWSQFQLEHEDKQKQNELHVQKAATVAMKRLEMDHLRKQQDADFQAVSYPPPLVKTELQTTGYGSDLVQPNDEPGLKRGGRRHKKIVQCRIPIASIPQAGTSAQDEDHNQQEMVQKITSLLIKHNFVQNQTKPHQITELVAKVRRMVATGQPMALGPGNDELSSSIAKVLLNQSTPMPPLTDVQEPPPAPPPPNVPEESKENKRGRKKTIAPPQEPPPPEPEPEPEPDGRRRRKAAIAAEKQFDSQQDVIDVDDDDGDDWQADADDAITVDDWLADIEANEPIQIEPIPIEKETTMPNKTPVVKDIIIKREKPNIFRARKIIQKQKETSKEMETSIVLSDDDAVEVSQVNAPAASSSKTSTTTTQEDDDIVELHPSLLTNPNFIKIVAHTYLAGNPMMDEDAATLAAQYSTLKTLKEAESEGKPITCGPVYDIAVQVLGKAVLRKLHVVNPKSGNEPTAASKQLNSLLGGTREPTPPPAPVVKKPKIGPKSKVRKDVKQELQDSPVTSREDKAPLTMPKITTVSKATLFAASSSRTSIRTNAASTREESILPDDDVVISQPAEASAVMKPILLRKIKLDRPPATLAASPGATPVALGRGPAPPAAAGPICLDSDDDEPPAAARPPAGPAPRRLTRIGVGPPPVPVALTGPNARTVPLAPAAPAAYFQLSPCGTKAFPVQAPSSAPGPGPQPVPLALLVPGGTPAAQRGPPAAATSASWAFPGRAPTPAAPPGPAPRPPAGPAPVPLSLVDARGRPVALPAGARPPTPPPPPAPALVSLPGPPKHTVCKPGDLLRITRSGLVEILENKKQSLNQTNLTMIIDDDDPEPAPPKTVPPPKTVRSAPPEPAPRALPKLAPKPPPRAAPKPPEPAPKVPSPPPKTAERPTKRKSRLSTSSSSSSSGRSRSPSPEDPLAILKDVVHIQAPARPTQKKVEAKPKPNALKAKPTSSTQKTDIPRSTDHKSKKNDTVDLTNISSTPKPGHSKAPGNSIPTDLYKKIRGTKDISKTSGPIKKDAPKLPSKKPSTSMPSSSKPSSSKPSSSKPSSSKPTATKLVGTSKSIILDGKSKSLKVDSVSSSWKPSSTKKLADKRAAPPTTATAPQKKSKIMTLKDFDIDDIDGIIELD